MANMNDYDDAVAQISAHYDRARQGPAPGTRVELVRTTDLLSRVRRGTHGTVALVDALGTVHVDWDDGSNLGLIPGVDVYRVLPEARAEVSEA